MKSSKLLAMGTMALAAASLASAATNIKITGSTAFRKATMVAIVNSLDNAEAAIAESGKNLGSADRVIVHGNLKSTGAEVYYQTAWAGSVGGVQTLVQDLTTPPNNPFGSNTTTWLATTTTMSAISVDGSFNFTGGTVADPGQVFESTPATADISMSDSFQSSTPYTSPALTDTIVGVVGFTWAKSVSSADVPAASYNRLTNINLQQAQALLTNGAVPLSFITGNSADDAYDVVATGRDNDSGTRVITFAESGFGVTTSPSQYSMDASGNLSIFASNSGYASGGSVKTALNVAIPTGKVSPNGVPFILVSYLGIGDDPDPTGAKNQKLTYNGNAYDVTGIQEGKYSFWGYEHMFYRTSLTDTVKLQAASDVVAQIGAGAALASGIKYDDGAGTTAGTLRVTRFVDGGVILSNVR